MRRYFVLTLACLIATLGLSPAAVYADPFQVRVCTPSVLNTRCQPSDPVTAPIRFESTGSATDYLPKTLKNEWPSASRFQALEAGAITVRTFAQRELGCGAFDYTYSDGLPVLNNDSQHYHGNSPDAVHHAVVQWTQGREIVRGSLICAKYKANNGDFTGGTGTPTELSPITDPVDSNCTLFTPCGPYAHLAGLSQNGTHAWELITPGLHGVQSTWQRMLTHYYTAVEFSAGTNLTYVPDAGKEYRWAWLNRGGTIVYNGSNGENYYSPVANTPATMTPGGVAEMLFPLHNTGTRTWESDGISVNPDHLGYHWLNLDGSTAPNWIDYRTPLPSPGWVAPGGVITPSARVYAPSVAGAYILEWDMVREGITWFNWQGGGRPATQTLLVAVGGSKGVALYNDIWYGGTNVYLTGDHPYFPDLGMNDLVTSLLVSPGCTIRLFEHAYYGGQSIEFKGSVPDLREYPCPNCIGDEQWPFKSWNDKASSIWVRGC